MQLTFAATVFAALVCCALSKPMMNLPKCPLSELFNNSRSDCGKQVFGENIPLPPPGNGPEPGQLHRGPKPTKAQHEELEKCMSEKLGFECHGTINPDDVDDILATVVVTDENIRAALTTEITNCITENQGVGEKVMRCVGESYKKNCS